MSAYKKAGLRALGLSLIAALGMTAFTVAGAQANWLILDPATVEPEVTVEVTAHKELKLLVKKETNLEILCAVIEPDAAAPIKLLAASIIAHGHLIIKTCKTWQNGADISAFCTPVEPILAGGLAELVKHKPIGSSGPENFILVKPLFIGGVEQNFTQIKFTSPCALPATNNIKGDLTLECGHLQPVGTFVHLDCKNHQVTQLLQEVPATELIPHKLLYGTKEALLHGIAAAKISAPELYAGKGWGGHV